MRAVGLDFESRRLTAREIPPPVQNEPNPGQVLFRVTEMGICGTDRELASFRFGSPPPGESFLVLGHEAVGQVVAAGPGVRGFEPGDWVVPMIRRPCPGCPSCGRRRPDLCQSGLYTERGITGAHGYFCDYALDDAHNLTAVPAHLAGVAVLIEPLSVVEKAVDLAFRLHAGEPRLAVVYGAGAVGLLAAMILRLRGVETGIRSTEPANHPRAEIVRRAGFPYNSPGHADIAIEAAGAPAAAYAALSALNPLGVCVVLGAPNAPGSMPFLDMIVNNQVLAGSVNASPEAFQAAARDLARLDRRTLDSIIERRNFADYALSMSRHGMESATHPKIVHVLAD
ncbi:MAG: zinc-binding dehydrogenase [Acidobacteria bacterium]|nr:zinc-binding dehydrogenase [Acidobacteriota bacterium]